MNNKELGEKGEQLAVEYLKKKGFEIVERNYRYGHGEIDIVANDPSTEYLVFVEVKARQNLEYAEPEYAINRTKQSQLKKIAQLYLFDKELKDVDCRFDVVAVLFQSKEEPLINHYENAFM